MNFTRATEVTSWLHQLNKSIEYQSFKKEQSPSFVKPFHLVTLALTLKKYQISEVELDKDIENYSTRMHLWDAAGIDSPIVINENNCSLSLLPVMPIKNSKDVDQIANDFQTIIDYHYAEDQQNDFGIVLSELLDNCYRHANKSDGLYGLSCVQAWSSGNKGQLCIADSGIGIRESLLLNQDYHGDLVTRNACEMATEIGISGKLGKSHSGYGLAITKGIIEHNQGNLYIISKNEMFHCNQYVTRASILESGWDGTLIIFEWNLDRPIDTRPVYESWPKEEEEDDEFGDMF